MSILKTIFKPFGFLFFNQGKTSRNARIILVILALAFFAAFLDYPSAWNKGADFLNAKLGLENSKIPHFFNKPFRLGLDLQGGTHLVFEADISQLKDTKPSEAMQGVRDVIERRVNIFGVAEPLVQVENDGDRHRLIVELAGVKDVNQAIKMIGETPFLDFREERTAEETNAIMEAQKNGQQLEEDPYFKPTSLTGRFLSGAEMDFDPNSGQPMVTLQFNDEGAKMFEELTSKNIGKRLAIFLDGMAISAPNVQESISGGRAQITGNFTYEEARTLSQRLKAGALPVPISLVSQQSVGPTLGQKSLDQSLKAGFFGFLAILLFLIIFYRIPGFFAALSLVGYIVFLLAIFKIFGITLSLAGIAGFVLSMGMAVDANILIFSRMREELAQGRSYAGSISEGFKRAWPSIRDGNFTTILVGLILFFLGTSFVKGFALILVIGNLIGMATAIFITYYLLKLFPSDKTKGAWLWR